MQSKFNSALSGRVTCNAARHACLDHPCGILIEGSKVTTVKKVCSGGHLPTLIFVDRVDPGSHMIRWGTDDFDNSTDKHFELVDLGTDLPGRWYDRF